MANAGTTGVEKEPIPSISLDSEQYEKLEKDCSAVLESMANDQSKQKARSEYEMLFRALKTSYENQKSLVKFCKEQKESIDANAKSAKGSADQEKGDSEEMAILRKEVAKVQRIIETARSKEVKATMIIKDLEAETKRLKEI